MKTPHALAIIVVFASVVFEPQAATLHVDVNGQNPAPPYSTWATAANVIQDAIDAAVAGDEIVVTNGVYATGGRTVSGYGTMTNRVAVDKAISVHSVNGPQVTVIQGRLAPSTIFGGSAIRCVFLASGASLSGFTLTNGATHSSGNLIFELSGGGVWCSATDAVVSQCVIAGNHAKMQGGGAYGGTLNNCLFTGNSATNAGATFSNVLNNCTITGNSSLLGVGGAASATLNNCIVYFNVGSSENYTQCSLNYCCTTPQPAAGSGNITSDPLFADGLGGNLRLQSNSPCINAGNNTFAPAGPDLNASARIFDNTVDIGAYEYQGDAAVVSGRHYVNATSASPVAPYTNWATAAVTIQDAVDVAAAGDEIVVTNGVYATGGRAVYITMTNRVAVDRPLTIRSVNGPIFTVIQGYQVPVTTNGSSAVRCVYLTDGARLSGFTLTNGATLTAAGDSRSLWGGGIYCDSSNAVVSNCIIVGNSALAGGGVCRGTLNNCSLVNNIAKDVGGGVFAVQSALNNCLLKGNSAADAGGGVYGGTLNNCTLTDNYANSGCGAFNATLNNCIVYFNFGNDYAFCTLNYCCTPSLSPGNGNIISDPLFTDRFAGNFRLQPDSPCVNAGNTAAAQGSTDLDGNSRIFGGTVDIGAYEYQGGFTPVAPYVVTQPTNQTVTVGANVLFAFMAAGTSPLRFQWLSNTVAIINATNAALLVTNAQLSYSGTLYSVTVTNFAGSATSSNALLTVNPAPLVTPRITMQLSNRTAVVGSNVTFTIAATGTQPLSYQWNLNGSTPAWATNASVTLTNVQLAQAGIYFVTITNVAGSVVSSNALLTVNLLPFSARRYVNASNATPSSPYTNWATAARTIQDAVDVAGAGDEVLVTNGVYATGGRAVNGSMTNRVAVTKVLNLRSVNGPQFTTIQGRQVPGTTNGDGAIRCVYLKAGVSLIGFTLTGGATRGFGNPFSEQEAGGVYCESIGVLISNCVITANSAYYLASAVLYGTLENSTISSNSSTFYNPGPPGAAYQSRMKNCDVVGNAGGGTFMVDMVNCLIRNNHGASAATWGVLSNCTILGNSSPFDGGGASYSTLVNCHLVSNTTSMFGGAAYQGTLVNCQLIGNSAGYGGGAAYSSLTNCTIAGNWAAHGGGVYGGTSSNGILNNCIVYFNAASIAGSNYAGGGLFNYSCTTPLPPGGSGDLDLNPLFMNLDVGDLSLQPNSPCINTGFNAYPWGTTDLGGNPRIVGGTVDIGAYEFQSTQPALKIAQSGGNIVLAWPTWASDFALQQVGAAPGCYTGGWSNLNALPTVTNNENTVMLPVDGEFKFYRLRKQ